MAFVVSKNHPPSLSQGAEEVSISDDTTHGGSTESATNSVTTCLYLKSSSSSSSSDRTTKSLDKDVVLRRIRHHKCLNKVRSTFRALLDSSSPSSEQKWLEQDDAFSAP